MDVAHRPIRTESSALLGVTLLVAPAALTRVRYFAGRRVVRLPGGAAGVPIAVWLPVVLPRLLVQTRAKGLWPGLPGVRRLPSGGPDGRTFVEP